MGTPQCGARTVPVRSAWAGRGALEKGDVFRPDNPLRTGTVRGPMQHDVPTGLNRYHRSAMASAMTLPQELNLYHLFSTRFDPHG